MGMVEATHPRLAVTTGTAAGGAPPSAWAFLIRHWDPQRSAQVAPAH